MVRDWKSTGRLNGICPYFTMFPLDFPRGALERYARPGDWVLDPFCGRGTTNYAARLLGLPTIGIDSSPVAAALAQAKLANVCPEDVVVAAGEVLEEVSAPQFLPTGEFWELAYHPATLHTLCRLREGLICSCETDARCALRVVVMGALHGPRPRSRPAYFSNQAQRTYAPKPRYAVNFWKSRGMRPEPVDVMELISERAHRFYGAEASVGRGAIIEGDSRVSTTYAGVDGLTFDWVITSPPYYGMRTYLPDQWLRLWFLGGPDRVEYRHAGQVDHSSPEQFTSDLKSVWSLVGDRCRKGAHLVVRFGGINDRNVPPLELLTQSLRDTGWTIDACLSAGSAVRGRRQALHISRQLTPPVEEHDLWLTWRP